MTHLLSLISDHLLPNYLFLKGIEGKYDALSFISMTGMERREVALRLGKALSFPENPIQRITVTEGYLKGYVVYDKLKKK
jgi:hypothetical protein